jgi:hypothetical protein
MSASVPRYTATGTVLEDERHGPQFCAGVAQSLPPQCSGIDLVGWDWSSVKHEAHDGVKWGEYTVVGTWDGTRITLTESPQAPRPDDSGDGSAFASPCPTPEGGWKPVDPAKATEKALQAAMRIARKSPRYAGTWVDQSYLGDGPIKEFEANDPTKLVLNFMFTGDIEGHEQRVRKVWGGALCVSPAKRTAAELNAVQRKVNKEIQGIQSSGVSVFENRVDVTVFVVTEELQQKLDSRYGPGTVRVWGVFEPVSG